MTNSILNTKVSCYKNYLTTTNPQDVNLLTWLKSEKYKNEVEAIRKLDTKVGRNTQIEPKNAK